MIVLPRRWSAKGLSLVILWKLQHVNSLGLPEDRALSQCNSFTQKIVMKRPYVTDTGEDFALYVHCLGLLGDTAISQYDTFTWEMVLKRPFVCDTCEETLCMFISGLPGDGTLQDDTADLKDGFEMAIHL